jgi:hypothetical protein
MVMTFLLCSVSCIGRRACLGACPTMVIQRLHAMLETAQVTGQVQLTDCPHCLEFQHALAVPAHHAVRFVGGRSQRACINGHGRAWVSHKRASYTLTRPNQRVTAQCNQEKICGMCHLLDVQPTPGLVRQRQHLHVSLLALQPRCSHNGGCHSYKVCFLLHQLNQISQRLSWWHPRFQEVCIPCGQGAYGTSQ